MRYAIAIGFVAALNATHLMVSGLPWGHALLIGTGLLIPQYLLIWGLLSLWDFIERTFGLTPE